MVTVTSDTFGAQAMPADDVLSAAGDRLRESYCQLKDARVWLRTQLQTEESNMEGQHSRTGIGRRSRGSSTCSPQSRMASESPDVVRAGAEGEPSSDGASPRSPCTNVNESLLGELEQLRGELEAERTSAKHLLSERDSFESEAAQALEEMKELHVSRDDAPADCKQRGKCALRFAKQNLAKAISLVENEVSQAELNRVCADRDKYFEQAELLATQADDLRDRLEKTRYECEVSNRLVANAGATIVRLRTERDSLTAECLAEQLEYARAVAEASCQQSEVECVQSECDVLAKLKDQAITSETTAHVQVELLRAECDSAGRHVERCAEQVAIQRTEVQACSAEKHCYDNQAKQSEAEVSALRADLEDAHAGCRDEARLMKNATTEFASMRSELVSLHIKQLNCEDRARSETSEVMSLCRQVENACAESSVLALQSEEAMLEISTLRSELAEARAHTEFQDLDADTASQPSARSQKDDNMSLMENVIKELYAEIEQMEDASLAEEGSENNVVVFEVASQGTQTSSEYITSQRELASALEECQHYRAHAEFTQVEMFELTAAAKSPGASRASQRRHDDAAEGQAINQLRQELLHYAGDFNASRAETSHLLGEFHMLRANLACEAATHTVTRLADAESRREADAAILAEVNASREEAQSLHAELGRCKAEVAAQEQLVEEMRDAAAAELISASTRANGVVEKAKAEMLQLQQELAASKSEVCQDPSQFVATVASSSGAISPRSSRTVTSLSPSLPSAASETPPSEAPQSWAKGLGQKLRSLNM